MTRLEEIKHEILLLSLEIERTDYDIIAAQTILEILKEQKIEFIRKKLELRLQEI